MRLHLQNKGIYENIGGDKLWLELMTTESSLNVGYLIKQVKQNTKQIESINHVC
jgi:hypothetical protein